MTSDELRADAEAILANEFPPRANNQPWLVDRATRLARHILAALPADDGEPVTADWLRACGWEPTEYRYFRVWIHRATRSAPVEVDETGGRFALKVNANCVARDATRGHVRRLFAALAVPLVEAPPSRPPAAC